MELAPYGDFCQLVKKAKIYNDETLVRTYFHQLVMGIEYLHSKGIAHVDLKLDNLLVGTNYFLKITDFDHTFKQGDGYVQGRGTRGYRAPEIMESCWKDPMKADIYSAGIILFALSSGKMPYSETPTESEKAKGMSVGNLFQMMFGEVDMFWKIHDQGNKFGQSLRDLFGKMV